MAIPLERSLLTTLAYADVFGYPLTETELWEYFIGKPTRLSKFREALKRLIHRKRIETYSAYYFLPGRKSQVHVRNKRAKIATRKLVIARKTAQYVALIPSVWCVGLSGALAMQNAPVEDDIDFFILCAPGTLWTTRLATTTLLDARQLRRKPGQVEVRDKICLNMFIDAARLTLPVKEQDMYAAHEIAQLKPLISKHESYEAFIYANRWVKRFLPHALIYKKPQSFRRKPATFIESLSKRSQLFYMRKRKTTEEIGRFMLRFHPQDARLGTLVAFKQKLQTMRVT